MKIVLLGNSGTGKTTLSRILVKQFGVRHLDLDWVAWDAEEPTERRPLEGSRVEIQRFLDAHARWVIEGCHSDLVEIALPHADFLAFLNPGLEICLRNARKRPWEPEKFKSAAEQDAILPFLLEWIAEYPHRNDVYSLQAHQSLYANFPGKKIELTSGSEDNCTKLLETLK